MPRWGVCCRIYGTIEAIEKIRIKLLDINAVDL